jgi:hypothetical protein
MPVKKSKIKKQEVKTENKKVKVEKKAEKTKNK